MPELHHATAVAVDGRAVLIRGPSGAGKSDIALRLIGGGHRWPGLTGDPMLVSDDQVELSLSGGRVMVRPPAAIAGRIEIRGIGILAVPYVAGATLALVVDLVEADAVPRLPESQSVTLLGLSVPRVRLDAFSASSPIKVLAALAAVP